jgi:hypothetical protein
MATLTAPRPPWPIESNVPGPLPPNVEALLPGHGRVAVLGDLGSLAATIAARRPGLAVDGFVRDCARVQRHRRLAEVLGLDGRLHFYRADPGDIAVRDAYDVVIVAAALPAESADAARRIAAAGAPVAFV